MTRFLGPALVLPAILTAHLAAGAVAPVVKNLTFPGGTERVLLLAPGRPKATLVLFVGGDGLVKLGADGSVGVPGNFLAHSRIDWVERGYAVLLPDVPAGTSTLMGRRLSDGYAAAVAALVDFAKQENPAPVWLIGTSQGTNAVVNAASRMTHGEIAGIILTASLTEPGKASDLKETVFGANLAAINVPVLIVSHTDDACSLSPPGDEEKLRSAFTASPKAKAILVSGGKTPASAGPCEAMTPHGFYGVEIEAIKHMASWISAH
jgi:dienelactone hydrolase